MDAKRTKLAKAVGWVWHQPTDNDKKLFDNGLGRWEFKGMFRDWSTKEELPFNPLTDANDCEALIKHLNAEGYSIDIKISTGSIGSFITLRHIAAGTVGKWQGDDWKQGVCELALRVLEG